MWGPGTPMGMPRRPQCCATTHPVPTGWHQQQVWDFKDSRLHLEPLSPFSESKWALWEWAELLLPKYLLGTPGCCHSTGALANAVGIVPWDMQQGPKACWQEGHGRSRGSFAAAGGMVFACLRCSVFLGQKCLRPTVWHC